MRFVPPFAVLVASVLIVAVGRAAPDAPIVPAPDASAVLTYDASRTTQETSVTLRREGNEVLLVDDVSRHVITRRPIVSTRRVVVNGLAREHNDSFTVDLRGDLRLPDGVMFDAGVAGFDTLSIVHDPAGEVRFDYEQDDARGHRGQVIVDGTVVSYSGIEPLTNTGSAAAMIFTLPAGGVTAQLQDDDTPGNNIVRLTGTGFEETTFTVPSSSLTINGGTGADLIITTADFSGDFKAGLTIDGSGDTIQLNALTLGNAGANAGNLSVSGYTIAVNGAINTSGGTSGSVALAGTVTLSNNVTSRSSQTYFGPFTLANPVTLVSTTNGNIDFNGTIDGGLALTVNTGGTTVFNAPVGNSVALANLTTDGAGATQVNTSTISTNGAQTFGDPVILGANPTFSSASNGDISFNNSVDGGFALTVFTGGGTNFSGVVGASMPLFSVTTNSAGLTRVAANVTTHTSQTYGDQLALFSGVTLASIANGDMIFAQIDNDFPLTINTAGNAVFTAPVGSLVALMSLTTDAPGTVVLTAAVTTNGPQQYGDAVILGGPATLTSSGAAPVIFFSSINGPFGLTVNTSGPTLLIGAIGQSNPLANLVTNAGGNTTINGPSITTSNEQTYNDPVFLNNSTTFTSASSADIAFNSTLDGGFALTVNTGGGTHFFGTTGGSTPLASVTTTAVGLTRVAANVTTTGPQIYGNPLALFASVTMTAGTNVVFSNTINGPFGLVINASGPTIFGGDIGMLTPLASLTTDAAGNTAMSVSSVTTAGTQSYGDPVTLVGNPITLSSSGNITFSNQVDGPGGLTKQGPGTMTLTAANTYSGGTSVQAGTLLLTNVSGSATGAGSVTIAGSATLSGPGTASGNVTALVDGAFSPGNAGIGTLHLGGSATTWHGSNTCTATARFDLSNAGSTSDQLAMTGTLLKGGGSKFRFDFQGIGHAAVYTVATFSNTTFSASDFTVTNLPSGLGGTFSIVGGTALQFTTAPSIGHPASLVATATSDTSVSLSWTSDTAVDHFEVWRNSGSGFSLLSNSVTGTNMTDNSAVAGTAYTYRVRAADCDNTTTAFSNSDVTFVFTDDPLAATSTTIKAAHVTQLRQAITALSQLAGTGTPTFTDPALPGIAIKLVHVTELRSALDVARAALGIPALTYASIGAGSIVRATHLTELRDGVK